MHKMCRMQCVLGLVVLYLTLAHSWDIVVSHGDLLDFYTNETKTGTVRFNSHNPAALAYDDVHNMLLYVDKQDDNDTICAYDISSKVNQCFIERNGKNIHGLSYDPGTGKLFFTDTNERSINWFSLQSGSNKYGNVLIKLDYGTPTDIVVDSCRGFVYWINTNLTTPTIERARFDGSDREVVIHINSMSVNTTYQLEPHSLTIDQQTQKIYWMEPSISPKYNIFDADLNGRNKRGLYTVSFAGSTYKNPSSNTLTISKTSLFWVDGCSVCEMNVWKLPKTPLTDDIKDFNLQTKSDTVSIAANYRIQERIPETKVCEAFARHVQNNWEGPFCVHGMKVIGKSFCKCAPGYIGERCDVSVCENYCFQGECSVNYDGLPKCRCKPGYSGDRCEVDACHGYCSNNGDCSLNDKSEPVCQCKGDYTGVRCEVSACLNYCIQGNCSVNDEGLPECSCNLGYSGKRCEDYACHGYCLNNGVCSLNEEDEPSCECEGSYEGTRCETVPNDICTTPSF